MTRRGLLRAGLLAAMAGGCSILPQRPFVERRAWPLEVRRSGPMRTPRRAPVLLVRTMRAAAGLEGQGLQSIAADGSLHTDYYERWTVPPADAVEEQLRAWLLASGLFSGVLAPGSRAHADYALETELLGLVAAPAQGTSRTSITVVLIDLRSGSPHLRLQADALGEAPLAGLTPSEIAQSARAAVATMLGEVERLLAGAL